VTPPRCPTCGLPAIPIYVPVVELARELRVTQRHVLRVIVRLGIHRYPMRRGPHPRRVSMVALPDAVRIADALPGTNAVKAFLRPASPLTLTYDNPHLSVTP
jgi:hypothetical protein